MLISHRNRNVVFLHLNVGISNKNIKKTPLTFFERDKNDEKPARVDATDHCVQPQKFIICSDRFRSCTVNICAPCAFKINRIIEQKKFHCNKSKLIDVDDDGDEFI